MPDTKITALTAIGANPINVATFPIPMVDLTDTSMAASGTTKKVTVNQILGAGGTATLASATITGDLTVDTSTLKVDSANNRVGIGTASPAVLFHAALPAATFGEVGRFYDSSGNGISFTANASSGFNQITSTGAQPLIVNVNSSERYRIASDGIATWSNVGGFAGTAMTLNATGLGVGRSPSYRLQASSGTKTTTASIATVVGITTTDADDFGIYFRLKTDATGANRYAAITSFDNGSGNGARDLVLQDLGGNVGIGITPSAWAAAFKPVQIGSGTVSSAFIGQTNSPVARIMTNSYFDGTNFVKVQNNTAGMYVLSNNQHEWHNAATGTGTFSFTQAMTLDASGNLLVGTTSAGGNRLNVQTASGDCLMLLKSQAANTNFVIDYVSNYGNYTIRKSGAAVWDYGVISDSSATPTFKIQNASSVGVQLVSGATAWTTLSDETMKDIIEPISNAVAKVGSLRSVIGKFKTDESSKRRSFLIAQDVQSVLPEAVDVIGENNELGLRYTEVIPLLVAAIKELTAEVNALKNA